MKIERATTGINKDLFFQYSIIPIISALPAELCTPKFCNPAILAMLFSSDFSFKDYDHK